MKPSGHVIMLGVGMIILFLLYQTKLKGPVVYIVALAIYGLILVNFQTIQSQITGTLHPDNKSKS